MSFESAIELAGRIRRREVSSLELTDHFIRRIEKYDDAINAVVVRDFDRAREAASAADAALARGEAQGPLHGLPMTIKEAYDIEGLPTTWGIPGMERNVATSDSASVESYKQAGALFMGKTNVPIHLADLQSYNDIYGTTHNPWDIERGPGGSSGGSAAALAAGLTGLESGSDIGGSIRNPAHFCGVYGHKPSYGIVPDTGHALPGMAAPPDLAVVGPMARSAGDLALAMEILAGPDRFQRPGWKLDLPAPAKKTLSEYRVVLWPTEQSAPVSREIADRVQQIGDRLAALGATVSDSARPNFVVEDSYEIYVSLLNSALSADQTLEQFQASREAAEALNPDDTSLSAAIRRATVLPHRDWLRFNHKRARLRLAWRSFFQDWDIVLCPQTSTTAFPHDHSPFQQRTLRVDDVERPYFEQIFWAGLVTVAFMPSTVFPTGLSADGLPIGLQAVGGEYQDRTCIDFARLIADEIGGFRAPPGYQD